MRVLLKLVLFFPLISGQELSTPIIEYAPRSYVCYKVSEPIVVDGKINDVSWQKANWSESFVDIEGNLKPNPFFDTKVKMLWDENYFYFVAQMEEPHVWATLKDRDAIIYKDNDFEIFLDPVFGNPVKNGRCDLESQFLARPTHMSFQNLAHVHSTRNP